MINNKRGNVWIAVSGLVISDNGSWLVVKKKYGGLKGYWSLPAGFVNAGETVDEAVIREVKEETGISCTVEGLLGVRTGVIKGEISDNMLLFLLKPEKEPFISVQEQELFEVAFMKPEQLIEDAASSELIRYIYSLGKLETKPVHNEINPGDRFGYTAYKLFL